MTGAEHYAEAEKLIGGVRSEMNNLLHRVATTEEIARAQVHATLALAAATADAANPERSAGYGVTS